jgi:hypothetical protein
MHAKQMCWEEYGGSFGTIWTEVTKQLERHLLTRSKQDGIKVDQYFISDDALSR